MAKGSGYKFVISYQLRHKCYQWLFMFQILYIYLNPEVQFNSIQFNSKTLFKDGDPVSLKFIFPWGHPNMKTNTTIIHTYIQKQNRFIRQSQANTTYTFIQNINTHT